MISTKPKEKRKRLGWVLKLSIIRDGLSFEFLAPHSLDECVAIFEKEKHLLTGSPTFRNWNWHSPVFSVSAKNSEMYEYAFAREQDRMFNQNVEGTISFHNAGTTIIKGLVKVGFGSQLFLFVYSLFFVGLGIAASVQIKHPIPLLITSGALLVNGISILNMNETVHVIIRTLTEWN